MNLFIPWLVFHVIICISLVVVVLMQSAKGAGLAGGTAFGGGVSNAVFGGRGAASFLSKATTVLAVTFMFNCGALALMSSNTRTVAQGGAVPTTSAVTRQAQEEQRKAQAAQQQVAQPFDTTSSIQVIPGEAVDEGSGSPDVGDSAGN